MAENPIQPPPPREGLTDQGFITRVWYRWMQLMAKMAFRSEDLEALVASDALHARGWTEFQKELEQLKKFVYLQSASQKDYQVEIERLEKLLYALKQHLPQELHSIAKPAFKDVFSTGKNIVLVREVFS